MKKILTIVIPTYNMQDYLRRCLDSLLVPAEQLPLMEVLVVNDGSKDNSSSIAHEYQDKYPQTFIVIDKENGNYGSCINKALTVATGKYIRILDADDWYDTENLSSLLTRLQNVDADVVINDYSRYVDGKVELKSNLFRKSDYLYSVLELLKEHEYGVKCVQMHSLCYKTKCFEGIDYHQTEGISYTDQEWNSMPWVNVNTVLYIPLNIYQYNLEREGQTCDSNVFFKKMPEQFVGIQNCIEKLEKIKERLDEFHQNLLFETICLRIVMLYYMMLIEQKQSPSCLVEFDKSLVSNYPKYADAVSEHPMNRRVFKYQYVKKWRDSDYAPLPVWVCNTFVTINKCIKTLKTFLAR